MDSRSFRSYGVDVTVESNSSELLDEAGEIARKSLLGNLTPSKARKPDVIFRLDQYGPQTYRLSVNAQEIAGGRSRRKFLKFFDAMLRATVGEYAPNLVFLHAGVVGWRGRAIVMPADSFKGKSTITAELVRRGAAYYSDDFALINENGLVHAFPREISMRDDAYRPFTMSPESIGGRRTEKPIPLGTILFTGYKKGAKWRPKVLSAGQGLLELIPFALSFRRNPEFCLRVLNSAAARAIIASSPRGTAEEFAPLILDFVDKNVN